MSDMPGIHREVIEYKLGIDPAFKPIKQKERRYTLERHETIRLEVNKLLEVIDDEEKNSVHFAVRDFLLH
jgi:hypothetical protein